jgi:uncharacterized protein YndB with AHSA1/START domain/DNA-binding transcriptional ArsR family regulator
MQPYGCLSYLQPYGCILGRDAMDEVFKALADPSRRALLDSLNARNGQTLRDLCAGLDMARQSVSKHLAVLEAANLVTTVRRGREKLHYLNAAPINAITERWIDRYDRERVRALGDLKTALETTVTTREFVYTTYIRTTPERLWRALTEPEFTRQYWGVALTSDWTVGSPITWEVQGVTIADPAQVVLEADRPHRLAYTWHTMTPEFGKAVGIPEDTLATIAAEPRSKVTFTLDPTGEDKVKLTVVHDGFEPDSTIFGMISDGWTELLSDLKTFLEKVPVG